MTKQLHIDIWSDIACPWCYVGKRRLEAALERFPHRDEVEIVWRAFELDPSARSTTPDHDGVTRSYAERLARKYRSSVEGAQRRLDQMVALAKEDGLDFRFDRIRPGNTFDAHRVLHLALDRGVQDAVKERLLLAYMTEGASMGDHETLARLGSEAGLDTDEVQGILASDAYAQEVREDEKEAAELGVTGVPFFVINHRYTISGAQSADTLVHVLNQAWGERASTVESKSGDGAEVCGPDGCAIPEGAQR